jgi:hypothetical protein
MATVLNGVVLVVSAILAFGLSRYHLSHPIDGQPKLVRYLLVVDIFGFVVGLTLLGILKFQGVALGA